ncbi:MAG: hypothetical protein ACT4N5_01970 [Nitrosopumilaceae archaeon]
MTELCRKCGEFLLSNVNCIICREPTQLVCKTCKNTTEEIIHQNCKYELDILRLFPTPPDTWFEKYRKINKNPKPTSIIKNKVTSESEKNDVIISIAKALERMGKPVLEQVCYNIYSKYNCYLIDCYDNREYLVDALKELFGKSYHSVIETIEENVEDHDSKSVKDFFEINTS